MVSVFTIFSRAIVESVFGLLMFVNQDVDNEHHVKYGYRKVADRERGKEGKRKRGKEREGLIIFVLRQASD